LINTKIVPERRVSINSEECELSYERDIPNFAYIIPEMEVPLVAKAMAVDVGLSGIVYQTNVPVFISCSNLLYRKVVSGME